MPTPTVMKTCPNCGTSVASTRFQCPKCKMVVSQMDAFAAAKKAAERKGVRAATIERTGGRPLWQRPIGWGAIFLLVIGTWFIVNWATTSPPPPWTKLPTSREEAINNFMSDIAVGDNPGYDKAYDLLSSEVRKQDDSDDQGRYRQLFHEVYRYLTGEFGDGWISQMKIDQDPNNPDEFNVHVDVETLHVFTSLRTPEDRVSHYGTHYAITGFDEFNVNEAGGMQQMAAIGGVLKAEAGEAALRNLQSVLGAAGARHREAPMENKLRLLPDLRDPRGVNKYEVFQIWPTRHDPVVRRRLTLITQDDRYSSEIKEAAQQVLSENVSEEERIAAHVQD